MRAALREGFETIAAVGGDGTLSEVARGFFEPLDETTRAVREMSEAFDETTPPRPVNARAALALLPAGTGDDFARSLAGRRQPLDFWLSRLVGHLRRQDGDDAGASAPPADVMLASVDGGARRFLCLNAASIGFSAEVLARVTSHTGAWRRLRGEARFALAAIGALAAWRNREVRISIDDEQLIECDSNLIVVANGAFAGGGMKFAPGARVDDGRLEILTGCRISRAGVVRELTRIHRGGHTVNPKILMTAGAHVFVETTDASAPLGVEADGDTRGHTPATFTVVPAAIRVVR